MAIVEKGTVGSGGGGGGGNGRPTNIDSSTLDVSGADYQKTVNIKPQETASSIEQANGKFDVKIDADTLERLPDGKIKVKDGAAGTPTDITSTSLDVGGSGYSKTVNLKPQSATMPIQVNPSGTFSLKVDNDTVKQTADGKIISQQTSITSNSFDITNIGDAYNKKIELKTQSATSAISSLNGILDVKVDNTTIEKDAATGNIKVKNANGQPTAITSTSLDIGGSGTYSTTANLKAQTETSAISNTNGQLDVKYDDTTIKKDTISGKLFAVGGGTGGGSVNSVNNVSPTNGDVEITGQEIATSQNDGTPIGTTLGNKSDKSSFKNSIIPFYLLNYKNNLSQWIMTLDASSSDLYFYPVQNDSNFPDTIRTDFYSKKNSFNESDVVCYFQTEIYPPSYTDAEKRNKIIRIKFFSYPFIFGNEFLLYDDELGWQQNSITFPSDTDVFFNNDKDSDNIISPIKFASMIDLSGDNNVDVDYLARTKSSMPYVLYPMYCNIKRLNKGDLFRNSTILWNTKKIIKPLLANEEYKIIFQNNYSVAVSNTGEYPIAKFALFDNNKQIIVEFGHWDFSEAKWVWNEDLKNYKFENADGFIVKEIIFSPDLDFNEAVILSGVERLTAVDNYFLFSTGFYEGTPINSGFFLWQIRKGDNVGSSCIRFISESIFKYPSNDAEVDEFITFRDDITKQTIILHAKKLKEDASTSVNIYFEFFKDDSQTPTVYNIMVDGQYVNNEALQFFFSKHNLKKAMVIDGNLNSNSIMAQFFISSVLSGFNSMSTFLRLSHTMFHLETHRWRNK